MFTRSLKKVVQRYEFIDNTQVVNDIFFATPENFTLLS
jgi:hypothetical protein